jgi:hypothetical protein
MSEKWHVRPTRPGLNIAHPIDGQIAAEADDAGNWSFWTPDQFTFQLIRDGALERVAVPDRKPAEPTKPASKGA